MTFEVFERTRPQASRKNYPAVRLSPNGAMLMLNVHAAALLPAGRVLLMFDAGTRQIAIRGTVDDDARGFRVNRMKSAANISCRSFAAHCQLRPGGQWELFPSGDLLVASVD